MSEPKRELPPLSDRLIEAAEAVRDLERQKRSVPISTPEFHALAQQVESHARDVFRLADSEDELGDQAVTTGETIDDIARESGS
jgi:hypothetical protein